MSQILVPLPDPPTGTPADVKAATPNCIKFMIGRGLLRVRLAVSNEAPVRVRPWFWARGRWWPMRADAESGVGAEPVSADSDLYEGKADQFYVVGNLSNHVVAVLESGDAEDIEALYFDLVDAPGA